jgi:hypothetical protein
MNHTKVIGINGFKRTGKGETGDAIASVAADYAQTATLLGFADKLKILGARTLGFTDLSDEECIALMDEAKEKWWIDLTAPKPSLMPVPGQGWAKKQITGRSYLQHLGTEARKVFGPDFWVDQVLPAAPYDKREVDRRYGTTYVAFTDLRFENEAERVLALGGEVWEVIRPGTESDGHDSEQVLPRELVTRQIENDGSLMDLRWKVEKALGL